MIYFLFNLKKIKSNIKKGGINIQNDGVILSVLHFRDGPTKEGLNIKINIFGG